jgi:thiamine-monophosphate kinase
MGAVPAWALLSLTMPQADEPWLRAFATGFGRLAREHDVALVGGDTTGGALVVTVQVLGFVPTGRGLRRAGGAPGDGIFVSGTPGDAAAGLALEMGAAGPGGLDEAWLRDRFLYPPPRVALGQQLRELASACIDVSDGLYGDLAKLAAASGCGAEVDAARLPLSPALLRLLGEDKALERALAGGDDYELCFTVPASRVAEAEARRNYRDFRSNAGKSSGALGSLGDLLRDRLPDAPAAPSAPAAAAKPPRRKATDPAVRSKPR